MKEALLLVGAHRANARFSIQGKKYNIAGLRSIIRFLPPTMSENSQNLKSIGLKATYPRLKILDLFQHTIHQHLAAEDVYRLLINDGMEIGLATVYRVLTQFEQAGLLERHYFETGKAVFELNKGKHHDHLVCLQCGRVEEFFDPEIERRQNAVATERGFAIKGHALYLYADCLRENCPHRDGETLSDSLVNPSPRERHLLP